MRPASAALSVAFALAAVLGTEVARAQAVERVVIGAGPAVVPAGAVRARAVQIDVHRLAEAAASHRPVSLDLLGDAPAVTTPDRVEWRGPGRFTWFGSVAGGGRATLTVEGDHVAGRVVTRRGAVVIEPRDGRHVAYEPGPDDEGAGDQVAPPVAPPYLGRGGGDPLFPDEFHVALFYTGAVADSLGSALPAVLQATVDALTDVLANSAVPARARLVASGPVDYAESGDMATDLYAFQDPFDGLMDGVHAVRDAHSADFAALLTETGANAATGCGIAFLQAFLDVGFADYAFSVTKRSCELGLVFSHEVGHNLGLHHDRYVTTGQGAFPFSHGFVNTDSMDVAAGRPGFRTVLAYERECTDVGGRCVRIPYYSNPDSLWNGQPMGAAGTEDNAQSAREAVPYASAFRAPALAATLAGTTAGGPTWRRPVCPDPTALVSCDVSSTEAPYRTAAFRVTAAGLHYVRSEVVFPGVLALYAGPFDPAAPLVNLAGYAEPDADAPAVRRLLLSAALEPGALYTLVTTGLGAGDAGAFSNGVFGPAAGQVVVGADGEPEPARMDVVLGPPSPNPSRGDVQMVVSVAEAQAVEVAVFDALGRRVAVLHDGPLAAGVPHALRLPADALRTGVYLVRARGAEGTVTQRVVRLR
ncbi:MAG TPA: zinc-dependent metalloprotease family protein [Rubricoccaceae bacterium]